MAHHSPAIPVSSLTSLVIIRLSAAFRFRLHCALLMGQVVHNVSLYVLQST